MSGYLGQILGRIEHIALAGHIDDQIGLSAGIELVAQVGDMGFDRIREWIAVSCPDLLHQL